MYKDKDEFQKIGFTNKVKGLKGAVKVSFEAFFLEYLIANPKSIDHFFMEMKGNFLPFFIEKMDKVTANTQYIGVYFEDIEDRDAAYPLQHQSIYLPKKQLAKLSINFETPLGEEEEGEFAYLKNYHIHTTDKQQIGRIQDLLYFPQQVLAQVFYQKTEILIPIHEDLIHSLNEATKIIVLDLPEGFLEVYLG